MKHPALFPVHCSLLALALPAAVSAQGFRGSLEPADVYEFTAPLEYELRYRRDAADPGRILNPDFFCTECAEEGRIPFQTREEMAEQLLTTVQYPFPVEGEKTRVHGHFRLMEHDGPLVLDYLFNQLKTRNPVYIEDRQFRLFTDLDGFSTRKFHYPRREIELLQLSDIFPKVSEKTVKLNSHQRAHLYLIRAHRIYRDFAHIVNYDPKAKYMQFLGPYLGTRQKFEFYVFRKQRYLGEFANTFLGHSKTLEGEVWHTLQDDSMVSLCDAESIHDVWLNNTFTHHLSYIFTQGFRGYQWDLPAWFLMGFGHLMERRERTDYNTFFFGEGKIPTDLWGSQKWKMAVRKRVSNGKLRPFVELAQFEHPNEIRPFEHGIIWSLVSYQMQVLGQDNFGRFVHVLKEKQKGESLYNLQVRAFRQIHGITMTEFEEGWKQWVLDTYKPY